jgi:hypothetical protein
MLASIHEKLSSLVHRHKNAASDTVEAPQETPVPVSQNWDFSITFQGAKVRKRGEKGNSDIFVLCACA